MSIESPRPMREVVGQRVRDLREEAGLRQDDLADVARNVMGLPWSRSRIAAIERGAVPIHAEDLVNLAVLLALKTRVAVTLADLVGDGGSVELTRTAHVPASDLATWLRGAPIDPDRFTIAVDVADLPGLDIDAAQQAAVRARAIITAAGVQEPTGAELLAVSKSSGEADERARRTLDEPAMVYNALCWALWRRSLSAERDARLGERPAASAASTAARRGRITRDLVQDARALLARAGEGEGT